MDSVDRNTYLTESLEEFAQACLKQFLKKTSGIHRDFFWRILVSLVKTSDDSLEKYLEESLVQKLDEFLEVSLKIFLKEFLTESPEESLKILSIISG